ncbi:hypothetical protein F4808DRAFT_289014 [Astrocystis sublimbata]|nr:hypothetical protein F4808DRAFT_289014 [Astrocystis sublimbata]
MHLPPGEPSRASSGWGWGNSKLGTGAGGLARLARWILSLPHHSPIFSMPLASTLLSPGVLAGASIVWAELGELGSSRDPRRHGQRDAGSPKSPAPLAALSHLVEPCTNRTAPPRRICPLSPLSPLSPEQTEPRSRRRPFSTPVNKPLPCSQLLASPITMRRL